MTDNIHALLQELLEVIISERECAKALDLESLQRESARKERLLEQLDIEGELAPEERELAVKIRFENRRNAYLLWSALNWIRESMEFFGRRSIPDSYSHSGTLIAGTNGGHLLSGRA